MPSNDISPGTVLMYKLRNVDRPTNPGRVWRGQVLRYHAYLHLAVVTLLEDGYEGLEDWVWSEQIVGIESAKKHQSYQSFLPLLFGFNLNME